MKPITLKIDGRTVAVEAGTSILDAALANGVYIPHLCHHPQLIPVGACRLCIVEIEGRPVTTSCNTPAADGMVVRTDTGELNELRRVLVELLIANHRGACLECSTSTDCELQKIARHVGVDEQRMKHLRRPEASAAVDSSNPFFERDMNKCVLCGICVRTCEEIQGTCAIDFAFRGYQTTIAPFGNVPLADSVCASCGECVVRCPTGALKPRNYVQPTSEERTICTYCGCGCGLYLGVRSGRVVSARGDAQNPASRGNLCVKGRFGNEFVNHPERLKKPLVRRNGQLVESDWDTALSMVAQRLAGYKGDAFAVIASGKCTNEENYLIQKFARAVMQTNHVDHCARLCHAPSVAGLAQTFGSGAMTNSIHEIGDARCILAIGTNTTSAHPIVALEIHRALRQGGRLIVINPRRIELTRWADLFLQQRPGSDVPLLMAMARVILEEGLEDTAFIAARCENFEAFREALAAFDPDTVERLTGVGLDKIVTAARMYAAIKPASIIYSMGITQHTHGTDNVFAISNLALLTGNIGKPSSGVNPLRGQNNVQGACDMGALPDVFSGYQKVADAAARAKFARAWGAPLSDKPGLTHVEIFDAAHTGRIKAVYLVGENPALSEADAGHLVEALERLEFLVVQDIFLTETARFADVVLPAVTFAEKDGTITNTERRVQRLRRALPPVGEARADWQITCELARRMGASGFEFTHPGEVMAEIAALTPSYGGISYERLERESLQWPCPHPEHPGTARLHVERFPTSTGKARFVPLSYRPSAELPDAEYPLLLTTDRSLFHFHTASMTGRVEGLKALHSTELVVLHPADAAALGVSDGEVVRIVSRRGEVTAHAHVANVLSPGVVAMTFHFPESPTNQVTHAALDPVAKIPETKVCAVKIRRLP